MGVGAGDALDALDFPVHGLQFVGGGTGDVKQEVKIAGKVVAVGDIGVADDVIVAKSRAVRMCILMLFSCFVQRYDFASSHTILIC